MRSNIFSHLEILGGGPAGIGIGYYAKIKKIPFSIYELSNRVGGNCKTIINGDYRYDTGAHRLHDKFDDITDEIKKLLGDELLKIDAPSKIYHKGSSIDFPLNIGSLLKNLENTQILKIAYEKFYNVIRGQNEISSFKDLAYHNYGKTLSELFLINYTEKLWGKNADQLDPNISGNRLKNLDLSSLVKSLIMYKSKPEHLDGSFYYPKYGFGTIFERMLESIGLENVHFNSRVEKIIHDGKKVKEIHCNGIKSQNVGSVINTLPINILPALFEPAPPVAVTDSLKSIKYRDVRLCILYLNTPNLTNNASIYFPETKFPFNRIYEPKNRSKKMAPKEKTCIVVETSTAQSNKSKLISDEDHYRKIQKCLIQEGFIKKKDIINYEVRFIKNAYPILTVGIQKQIKPALSYFTSFENHYLHGRNAQFQYTHVHDLFKSSKKFVNQKNL